MGGSFPGLSPRASSPRPVRPSADTEVFLNPAQLAFQTGQALVEGGDGFVLRLGGGAVQFADLADERDVTVDLPTQRLDGPQTLLRGLRGRLPGPRVPRRLGGRGGGAGAGSGFRLADQGRC